MTLEPNILREARDILKLYSTQQQELIKKNLYGPLEARLAGVIVAGSLTVVSFEQPTETEAIQQIQDSAWECVSELCRLLREASTIIEERVAGDHFALLQTIETQVAQAEENFVYDVEDEEKKTIVVVVFPTLNGDREMLAITDLVMKLNSRSIKTWVADESDQNKRLKAMTIREIYNVGRIASVVITNSDGLVLDGWYNGLPWVDEVIAKVEELRR